MPSPSTSARRIVVNWGARSKPAASESGGPSSSLSKLTREPPSRAVQQRTPVVVLKQASARPSPSMSPIRSVEKREISSKVVVPPASLGSKLGPGTPRSKPCPDAR